MTLNKTHDNSETEEKPDEAALLASAEAIGRLAEEESKEADKNARFSDRVAQAIKEAQIHKLLRPKRYDGLSVTPRVFEKVIRIVARHSVAAAWLTYFYPIHEAWVSHLPPQGREEIFGQGGLVADVFTPIGRAERDGNGYRLYGQWKFASGVLWADWIGLGALVEFPDSEGPEPCLLAVHKSDVKVVENWDTLGLRATGSNEVVVDGAWVPLHRILPIARVVRTGKPIGGDADEDEPIYRMPFFTWFLVGFPAIAVGGADRVLDIFRERTEKRIRVYQMGAKERDAPSSQRLLAELRTQLDAAEALVDRYVGQLESWMKEGKTLVSEEERERMFAWRAQTAKMSAEIAPRAMLALGGTAFFKGDPVELFTRDLLTVASHTTHMYEDALAAYGRTMFGQPGHPIW
ncbi:acyl-CoA dehydrogenase family protein [Brevibacillus centrosporus]|jgi:3-hydroxy-9,10-secoandrosta-1,3,5(10)-triene-9,17-dione monooxygenase|uniref:acyl-CoA dehydrogenase family protein n=1 Tax=Brevibacillus centrosporus TaxID=54910 RepID=UPI00398790BF